VNAVNAVNLELFCCQLNLSTTINKIIPLCKIRLADVNSQGLENCGFYSGTNFLFSEEIFTQNILLLFSNIAIREGLDESLIVER
jgi:hypothetical protein